MGVDFYHCDNCKESYPDCGDNLTQTCLVCHKRICDECIKDYTHDHADISHWKDGEPAYQDDDCNLLQEYCPICNITQKSKIPRCKECNDRIYSREETDFGECNKCSAAKYRGLQ